MEISEITIGRLLFFAIIGVNEIGQAIKNYFKSKTNKGVWDE